MNAKLLPILLAAAFLCWLTLVGQDSAQSPNEETLKKLLALPSRRRQQRRQVNDRGGPACTRAKLTGKADAIANQPDGAAQKAARAAKKAKRAAGPEIKPDHADLSYGPHPNNKLDLWLAKSDRPTPLVVFIHGGGFVGGDKSGVSAAAIKQCLDAGVSFASINYRFRTEAPINTVLRDSARAIQFLRYRADEFHLDKSRVAAFGGSAGAGTSLWLAFHDDLADLKSDDSVLRESTRSLPPPPPRGKHLTASSAGADVLGSDEAMRFYPQDTWPAFYGLTTLDEVHGPRGKELRADVDMLGLISRDDPPVWLGASDRHDALENKGDTNHSPKHSEAIKKRCDEVGVPCVFKIGNAAAGDGEQTPVEFLLKQIQASRE